MPLGRQVLATPAVAVEASALQSVALDASGLAPGVYLYRLSVQSQGAHHALTGRLGIVR